MPMDIQTSDTQAQTPTPVEQWRERGWRESHRARGKGVRKGERDSVSIHSTPGSCTSCLDVQALRLCIPDAKQQAIGLSLYLLHPDHMHNRQSCRRTTNIDEAKIIDTASG